MIIFNAKIKDELKSIEIEKGVIKNVLENTNSGDFDAKGMRVIPGLIDVHTHGMFGLDTMDADFEKMCYLYAKSGTTSFLPTTMTMSMQDISKVCEAKTDFPGANILGFHLEGPYISKKYKGAQDEKYIKNPSVDEYARFNNVKMITVAPESEGCMRFIKAVSKDVIVSIGHTDCDYKTALQAIENGANCLTHTFNRMPPIHHRDTGPVGAACEKGIYAQIICDGTHVSPDMIKLAFKLFGEDRVILISDSIKCAKCDDGEYECGGLRVLLKNGSATLENGALAGSCFSLLDCVKYAVSIGFDFDLAVKMASENPARLLGVNKGKIEKGYAADLCVLDENFEVFATVIGGKIL